MSASVETITCGKCGHSFDSNEEKIEHIKLTHDKPKTWKQKADA